MTDELKKLDRHKRRENKRHGKSDKFKEMKSKFDSKLKAEAERYLHKKECYWGKSYQFIQGQ